MSGVTGSFSRLETLRRGLRELSGPRFRAKVAHLLASDSVKLVQDCFVGERDPYGVRWAPLKRERRRNMLARRRQERRWAKAGHKPSAAERDALRDKILQDTDRLRTSVAGKNTASGPWGFKITVPVKYASVHQFGGHVRGGRRGLSRPVVIYHNTRTGRFMSRRNAAKGMTGAAGRMIRERNFGSGFDIPARPFLPTRDQGLPPTWRDTFRRTVEQAVREQLGSK